MLKIKIYSEANIIFEMESEGHAEPEVCAAISSLQREFINFLIWEGATVDYRAPAPGSLTFQVKAVPTELKETVKVLSKFLIFSLEQIMKFDSKMVKIKHL